MENVKGEKRQSYRRIHFFIFKKKRVDGIVNFRESKQVRVSTKLLPKIAIDILKKKKKIVY